MKLFELDMFTTLGALMAMVFTYEAIRSWFFRGATIAEIARKTKDWPEARQFDSQQLEQAVRVHIESTLPLYVILAAIGWGIFLLGLLRSQPLN